MSTAATGKAGDATETVESTAQNDNKVHPVRLGHANIYFIETASGYILVDAGMLRMEGELDGAFKTAGVDPNGVRLIIATHGHLDHIGSMAYAREVSGGEVLCHRSYPGDLENGRWKRPSPEISLAVCCIC